MGLSVVCSALALYHAYDCPKPLRTVGKALAWAIPPCQAIIYFVHGNVIGEEVIYQGAAKPVHWTAAIVFIVAVLACVGLAFLHARTRVRRFNILLGVLAAVLVGMLAVFFTIGKSGLFESVPLWALLIMLFLAHCTPWFRETTPAYGHPSTEGNH